MSDPADAGAGPERRQPESPADDALVDRARRDPRAFAPLYDRYAEPVYRYCYRRLGNHETAADATSQTFLKALAALPSYRQGTFRGWLFTIAAHVVTDLHRRTRPLASLDHDTVAALAVVDRAPSPEDHALLNEGRESVEALLMTLTDDQRRVVELRLAGLTGPEIAAALGISETAVRSSQFRAYARLRRLLAESGREDIRHAR